MEETLNELLEQEAEKLTQAAGMSEMRLARATAAATMTGILPLPPEMSRSMFPDSRASHLRLLSLSDIAAGKAAWEEALIEMYLAGVSVRRVEDITEALWGSKVSPATISELNKKAYVHIEDWAEPSFAGRQISVCLCRRYLPAAQLGRRVRKCSHFGSHCSE